MNMEFRRPWAKPAPKDQNGRWVWAWRRHNTDTGTKWMCWLWRHRYGDPDTAKVRI